MAPLGRAGSTGRVPAASVFVGRPELRRPGRPEQTPQPQP